MSPNSSATDQTTPATELEESTIASHRDIIETVIDSMDQTDSAQVSRGEGGNLWKFKYGSVEVFVQLTGETDDDTITVWSSVLKLPAKNDAALYRKLLDLNWSATYESRFSIVNEQVVVVATRSVADLSPGEISRAITVVATVADDNDDALQAEFGA